MKDRVADVWTWLFWQSGFTWREWRDLRNDVRADPDMPEHWNGEW